MDELASDGVDLERANVARVYDYLLGGAHNFAVDREHAARVLAANPDQQFAIYANRDFLRRVVRWCSARGIDQFLDLGSGIPTVGNVHEIAHQADPATRVAYVDHEPVAVAHSTEIIAGLDTVTVTRADLRRPDTVLTAPTVAGLLDFDRPVALLAVACLHFVHEDLEPIMSSYRSALAPGSVLAVSHGSDDIDDAALAARLRAVEEAYRNSASPAILRSRAEIAAVLGDFSPAGPGVVDITDWPEPATPRRCAAAYAAVGIAPRRASGHGAGR